MSTEVFSSLLFINSLLTSLTVESLKGTTKIPNNVMAGISAVAIAIISCIYYAVWTDILITAQFVMSGVALAAFSFLGSTVGYDKVFQTIQQIQRGKADENK